MKEPGPIDMAVGHPAVVVTGSVLTLGALVAALNDGGWWPIFTLLAIAMVPICKAAEARQAYLPWKREWDGMAWPAMPRQRAPASPTAKRRAGIAMLILLGLFFAANARDPAYAGALIWLVLACAIAAVVAAVVKRRQPKPAGEAQSQAVTICTHKPLLMMPTMLDAYRALPPHCQALFAAQERGR
jgi:hypothetical protein